MAIKIAISNAKGGVGKTTTAIMVALELKRLGKKVLIVDTDPQCNTTKFYGGKSEDEVTIEDILCDETPAEEGIQHLEYGDLIPSDPGMKFADTKIRPDDYRSLHFKRAGKGLDDLYDYIIIDTPPQEGVILRNVMMYVDYVIIPVQESGWALDGLMTFYEDTIDQAKNTFNPSLKIAGILIVSSRPMTNEAKRILSFAEVLAEKMDTKVFDTKIRHSVKITEALTDYRVPLRDVEPGNSVQLGYETFTQELIETVERN